MSPHVFDAEVWVWEEDPPWHFVALPEGLADEIDAMVQGRPSRGFGSVPVEVTVGSTTWRTSIFPDAARGSFLLPLKKAVRQAEGLVEGTSAEVALEVLEPVTRIQEEVVRSTDVQQRAAMVIARLEGLADPVLRADMDPRYNIPSEHALGVPMREMKALARELGTDHDLAVMLWGTGLYEARTVAVHVADPDALTAEEMDAWCADFDSWAIVDTACFALFDRTPHAWAAVGRWVADDRELVRRAGFALLWALALHDKASPDDRFADALRLVEVHADDDRHLVEKAIAMALKAVGKMRTSLRGPVRDLADRLAARPQGPARRIGRAALRAVPAP